VRETRVEMPAPGIVTRDTFTYADGHTTCYLAEVRADYVIVYRAADGRDVAHLTPGTGDASETVECDGKTYTLTAAMVDDPTCRDLNINQCAFGTSCP
jgi:hypothetical protein